VSASYGTCFYSIGDKPGTLSAIWRSADMPEGAIGTGRAVGGPTDGSLAGNYQISYFTSDGSLDAEFDLHIKQSGPTYAITWTIGDNVVCEGTGIDVAGGIVLAYMAP
tara:strand:- start:374 stop:697 length:324 start_codon:yes stop_codon:yes gene_type:complete